MLHVRNDNLVVESKGIYSIEKFLIARRLMYWQVYLHKTAIVAEKMLMKILQRARSLCVNENGLYAPPQLLYFLKQSFTIDDFMSNPVVIANFALLDDGDIMSAIKSWINHDDFVLSNLSKSLYHRDLLHIEVRKESFDKKLIKEIKKKVKEMYQLNNRDEISYFVYTDTIENHAYSITDEKINILYSGEEIRDVSDASDILNLSVLGKNVKKNILCYPKSLRKWVDEIS